ncbi:MAG: MAPEG family protein [Betaproteobacteria bacterium]|nr:MAPEG family protein [Betaproteobacteria bacterium]MDE2046830.1 MAPEG family protein [Betaproteobacteria bacterium]
MPHPLALVCTAILGLLVFGLGLAISGLRFVRRRLSGYEDDPGDLLYRFVRAHGNATEYAPFLAVLFLYLGTRGPGHTTLWLIAAATVSRVLHAVGMIAWPSVAKPNPLRFVGALGTYFCGIGLCVALLYATMAPT